MRNLSTTIISILSILTLLGWSPPPVAAATTIGPNISTGGNLTANGALQFTSGAVNNYILKTDGSGNATWISVGTALGTTDTDSLPQGTTNLYYSDATADARITAQKGFANGLATLDGTGKIPSAQLPAIAITNVYVAADIAARNALTPFQGDVAIVLDAGGGAGDSRSYIYDGAVWQELLDPTNLYLSKANNLSDLTSVSTAQTNLGLGTGDSPTFSGLNLSNYLNFSPVAPPAYSEGRLYYDNTLKSLSYYNDQISVDIGQKNILRVENNSGGSISFGQVVYISGAGTGGIPDIDLARADSAITSKVLGFAAENIANGSQGYVTAYGMLTNLNTAVFTAGDPIYLSPTTAGGITATRPVQPNYEIPVGYIGKSGAADGTILAFVVPKLSTQVTPGGVPFGNTAGYLIDDSANLFWDNTLKRLGIGTNTPGYALDVNGDIKVANGSLFYLGTNNGVPAGPVAANGSMYYDTGSNKFRCYISGAWSDCDTTGGTVSLQNAYNNGATITTAGGTDIAFNLTNIGEDFNVSGAGAVSLTPTGASSFTSAGALTLTGGATSTWGTSAGDLNLAVNGAATGNVQIGTGGAGTATPDYLALDVKSTTGDPAGGAEGEMYYNTFDNKFRCYENAGWTDCISISAAPILSSIIAATAANSINNGDNAQTWNWNLTNNNKSGLALGENTASTGTGTSILKVSTLATSTATPLYINNIGEGDSFMVNDESGDTTPFVITKTGQVGIGTNTFTVGNTEKLKVEGVPGSGNTIAGYGDIDAPLFINVQNRNSGASAASAFAAGSDDTTDTTNYVAAGIASSGFNDPSYAIAGPHDAFLFNVGDFTGTQGGNMIIGTAEPGMSVKFISGGGLAAANEQMRIDGSGNVGIHTTTPGSDLDVKGTLRLSGATSGYVGLAPAAVAGSTTYTLPSADGSAGQALATDGSGNLGWVSATSNWQKVATTLSPLTAGDDVTTSGDIYTSGSGTITSAGLLTGQLGLTVTGAGVSLNSGATAASNFNTSINEGTSTGTVTIGNSAAGAIGITSGAGLTLTGGATSTWGTSTGNLNLAVNGSGSGNVQIGTGIASATPDLLVFDLGSAEPGGTNGAMYYNTGTNNFRCYINGSWVDCASARLSSLNAATGANSINNGDNAQTWNWNLTNNNKSGMTFAENTASTGTGTSIVNVSNLASSTAVPLVVINRGTAPSFMVENLPNDPTPPLYIEPAGTTPIVHDGHLAIGSNFFDPTNPEKLKVDSGTENSFNVISASGDLDNYLQLNIQNRNAGGSASSDLVATADNGDESNYYVDLGINSSGYSDPGYTIGGPNDAYLLVQGGGGAGGNLALGTGTAGTVIKFYTGGSLAANEKMRIEDTGNVGIGTTSLNARLDVAPATADALRIEPYGAVAGNTGNLEFMDLAGTNYVGFKAPDTIASDVAWTLPNADGTIGQMLATDGSGTLSWASATGVWQRVGTTLSPTTAGDAVTSDGLLTGQLGLTVTGAAVSLNDGVSNFNTTINTGTSTGSVTIGNSAAGAVGITSGAGLTLTGGTASSFSTTTGDIKFQPAGSGTTGYVKIGEGQTGSTTPDMLALDVTSIAFGSGDPAGSFDDGSMYYNEAANKFRCRINGSWSDCDTTGGTPTLQLAYNGGATITTTGGVDIAFNLTNVGEDFNVSGNGAVNLTPTGALTLTAGAPSTWSTSAGALTITSAAGATWGTSAGDLTLRANSGVTNNVKIGNGGAGTNTPNLFAVDVKSTTGDPAGGYNGAMYYNQFDDVFRCYEAGGWKNCGSSAASATTLQQAYTAGPTISTSGSNIAFTLNTTDQFTASGAGSVNLTPTGASSFTTGAGSALTLTGGGASTWSTSAGALTVDSAAGLNLGTTNATGIIIGKAGITTTNIGTLQTGNAATAGNLKIADGSTNFITLTSPAIASDYTLTLPTTAGSSGQALTTNGSGTLSWASLLTDPMTARGDIIVRDATNTTARLPIGSAGYVLKSTGAGPDVAWAALTSTDVGLGNVTNDAQIPKAIGTAKGDLIAYTASNTPVRLPVGGTTGFVLTVDPGQASGMKWAANTPAADSLDFTEFKDAMAVDANTSINLAGQSLTINDLTGGGALSMTTNAAALTLTAGAASTWSTSSGALTVDSAAGLNLGTTNATGITIGKSGVTTTNIGTLQTGNAATTGSFKIADGSTNFITLTSPAIAADYTLTLPVDDGTSGQALTTNGTGTLSWASIFADPMTTRGDIIIRDATNTTARLGKGIAGQVLKSDGTDIAYATLTGSDVGLANVTNDAQIPKAIGTAKGDLIAYTASNTPARLPIGALNGQYLTIDNTQASGMKWANLAVSANSLDFTEFKDAMAVDANTSINLAGKNLTINDLTGAGVLSMTTNAAALTLTAGAASTWSTSSGALTVDSAAGLNLGTTNATALSLGRAAATFAVASTGLNVSTAGALTGVASLDTIATSATALTFAGTGTISSTTSGALTLDSGTTGDVNLGTGATAKNIKIGNATGATNVNVLAGSGNVTLGTSDTTGTLLVLDTKTGAGDPGGVNGGMYYNSGENKFKCYEAGAWKNCDSASAIGLQQAYNNGATITTAGGNAITFTTPIGSNNSGLVISQNNTTNNPVALQITNAGTGNDITATNWSITKAGNISTSGNVTTTGSGVMTSAGLLTGQLGLTVTGAAVSLNSGSTAASNFNTSINEGTSTGTVTIGNSAAGAISITSGSTVSITSGTTNALTLDSGTTGAVNLGTGASAKTITIGNAASTAVKIAKLGTQYGIVYTSATDGTLAQTAAGTAGQFLQSNGTSAPTWANVFTPKIGQFYDSAGGTSITTSSVVIPFNQETVKDANYTHSTVTNPSQITFAVSGYYKISYNISSHDTTDSRENVQCRARIDGTTDIVPSKSYSYGRNTTDKDQTNSATFFYNATATHYLEIVCTLSGSNYTASTNANESWATLEFIR